jgi:hypothetical protein
MRRRWVTAVSNNILAVQAFIYLQISGIGKVSAKSKHMVINAKIFVKI